MNNVIKLIASSGQGVQAITNYLNSQPCKFKQLGAAILTDHPFIDLAGFNDVYSHLANVQELNEWDLEQWESHIKGTYS